MICTRCKGTGFLNIHQIPDGIDTTEKILKWLDETTVDPEVDCNCHISAPCFRCENLHDVTVCDCCGDGEIWYGVPGKHYNSEDPQGFNGPYSGGVSGCH